MSAQDSQPFPPGPCLGHGTTTPNSAPELETWELSKFLPLTTTPTTTLDGHEIVLIVLSEILHHPHHLPDCSGTNYNCYKESPSSQCPQCPTLYPIIGTARAYLKCSSSPPTHKVQGPRQGSYGHHLDPYTSFQAHFLCQPSLAPAIPSSLAGRTTLR